MWTWILTGLLLATWAAMGIEAWTVKKEREQIRRSIADLRDAMHNSNVDTIGIAKKGDSEIAEELARVEKFARDTDAIAVGASSRITALGEALTKDHRDLARVVENDYQLMLAHLDAHHGDSKGDKAKPWRNVPRIAGRVDPNRKENA